MLWHKMAIPAILLKPAMSLNVSLPPELENRVRQHVESGLYSSSSEVIREALRLFEAYQGIQAANLAALKADIDQGVADVNAGRVREVKMSIIKERGRAIRATPKSV
jgi:antitoxin ParD1/3/4